MFGTGLILAVTLMHIYVFWRAGSVPLLRRHVRRRVLMGAGIILWAVFFFGRSLGHDQSSPLASALELFGMNWMAGLFLICFCLLAIDLITGFGFLWSRRAPLLRGLALVAGGMLSVVALIQGLRPPVVQPYEVDLSDLPQERDGTVLVALSDLHLGSQLGEHWLAARVAQVQAQQPDVIVLLGDLFEGHGSSPDELLPLLRRLSAPLGKWAILGNHEFHGSESKSVTLLQEAGFQVLRNTWVEVSPGLVLVGVDELTPRRRPGVDYDPLAQALANRPPGTTILLAHIPQQIDRIATTDVGLLLCGHTHGGQLWPFSYLVQSFHPWLEGQYKVEGELTAIICRGTGTWGPRMRLWRPGEILRVTLRRQEQQKPDGWTAVGY